MPSSDFEQALEASFESCKSDGEGLSYSYHILEEETTLLQIEKQFHNEMITHALQDDSIECCGILAGTNGRFHKLYRMTNVENSPYRFSWDSKELIKVWNEMEDNGWEHRAVYHSHTHSEAYPSSTDVRLAAWPEAYYIIISLMDKEKPVFRAFQIVDEVISEEELQVV